MITLDTEHIYSVSDAKTIIDEAIKKGVCLKYKSLSYYNIICAFDIETSTVWLDEDKEKYDVHSFMYVWQFQIEDYTIIGRTWDDFLNFLQVLKADLDRFVAPVAIIIWVHSLAYEFSFLSGIYPFRDDECFFRDVRKPIYCKMFGCFEFRCSYLQTNMSLSTLCKQMGVKQKLSGQKFNYEKVRYPWTELTDYELEYIVTDVESLVKAMKKRIVLGGDTLLTVPLTSTGYVRRECKESLKDLYYKINDIKPMIDEYKLLRKAFRGGNCHSNREMVGKVLEDVYSYDIVSSYPTQQLTQQFPMTKYQWLKPPISIKTIAMYQGLNFSIVALYQFKNIRLKDEHEPMPYISLSKCRGYGYSSFDGWMKQKQVIDNGRILEADYIEIALTEIDLEIVLDQYDFDEMGILQCMIAKKDYLPQEYRNVIMKYYTHKTALRGDDSEEGLFLYGHSKSLLNGVYGMSATDPIHAEIKYCKGKYRKSDYNIVPTGKIDFPYLTTKDQQRMRKRGRLFHLDRKRVHAKYKKWREETNRNGVNKILKKAPFPYQWGLYTTCLARFQLHQAIKLCGKQLAYIDTDSVKTVGPVPIEKLNDKLLMKAKQAKAFADDRNGKRHYIGLFESDGHYTRFLTQGSKRYCYEKDKKLGITVSGVTKHVNEKTGIPFAVEELKTKGDKTLSNLEAMKRFKPEFTWVKAGGTMSVYNDKDDFDYVDPETGKTVHIGKNVAIVSSTYKMTYSKDYSELLTNISLYGTYKRERE